MAERTPINPPTTAPSGTNLEEWIRGIAQAVVRILADRPSGRFHADSPAQLTSDQDDYDHGDVDVLRLTAQAPGVSISGFDANGQSPFWVVNVGAQPITIEHLGAGSAAANQITISGGVDVSLATASDSMLLWYDEESTTWRSLSQNT